MEKYIDDLFDELSRLKKLEAKVNKDKRYIGNVPKGSLYVSQSHGVAQYYIREEGTGKRKYLPNSERETARKLAQLSYDEKMLRIIQKQQKVIQNFLNNYDSEALKKHFEKIGKARKQLVNPLFETDEQYIARWYREHPGNQNSMSMEYEYETNRGERVRSKSEKILADLLYKMGIPYQYEVRLDLKTGRIYPDFCLLHVRRRETSYWEHFGLIEQEQYAAKKFSAAG
jgi:hypothetical protein